VSAIPFTPVTGARMLISDELDRTEFLKALQTFLPGHCARHGFSSWHLLFPEQSISNIFEMPYLQRKAVHFQWSNNDYLCFDDFLAEFSSRKRKNLRKERASISQQGVVIEVLDGAEIGADVWHQFYDFYQMTYAKRSGHGGYLPADFFEQISSTMRDDMVLVMAKYNEEYIAGALNFKGVDALYGRYWGCIEELKNLHFEVCYYQGIEYCIKQGLSRFDPGVQGEHKIQRGFRPRYTYSNHYIAEQGFRQPIADFLAQENTMLLEYYADAEAYLPFKS